MPRAAPSLSTDQIAAFVELSRRGSLRRAAAALHITEQGLRNRLIALEKRLHVELYRKGRGLRRSVPLLPGGVVTRGCRVVVRKLREAIRPINSGILTRRGETLTPAAAAFLNFIRRKRQ